MGGASLLAISGLPPLKPPGPVPPAGPSNPALVHEGEDCWYGCGGGGARGLIVPWLDRWVPATSRMIRMTLSCAALALDSPPTHNPRPKDPAYARRARAPPRESGADPRVSVEAIVVCHVSEITSK